MINRPTFTFVAASTADVSLFLLFLLYSVLALRDSVLFLFKGGGKAIATKG